MNMTRQSACQSDVIALLGQLDAYFAALYPAESNHLMDIASLTGPEGAFLVARDAHGKLAACGAYVARGAYAEVKRIVVDPAFRGQGIGGLLLAKMVARARADGFDSLKLETGISQPEALGLYRRDGFTEIEPFGHYQLDPLSIFMEKRL